MKGLIERLLAIGLKKKVLLGYIMMSLIIFIIVGFIAINFFHIKAEYDSMNLMSDDMRLIAQLRASIDGTRAAFLLMAIAKNPDVRKGQEIVINAHLETIDEGLKKLKGGRYRERIIEVEKAWIPFKGTLLNEIIPIIKQGNINEMMGILGKVQAPRANIFLRITDEMIEDSRKEFARNVTAINGEIKTTIATVIAIIGALFASAFLFSFWFINRYVIGVLHGISSSAEKVAGGDLTVKVEAKTGDEFGKLAADVGKIIKTMQTVLGDIASRTVNILKETAHLSLFGRDVAQRVDKDLERTTTAATATEEMSSTIGDIARNINVASQAAERAKTASSQGKEMINETVSSIDEVNTQIEKASGKVNDLSEFSKKIDKIVDMIKDIADQTNLLALNAAIEAARAGEQGRGFAVVADEVRKLAHRTANATSEINNILNSIHAGTVDATGIMDIAVEKAKATSDIARRLEGSFMEIYENFEKVSDMVHQVVTATEEQSATANEISSNLNSIAGDAKESSNIVKDMALSFNRFGVSAKEFLSILNNFNDPRMRLGVLKADYVLWLHRVIEFIDQKETSLYSADELHADKSRMGLWYYGEGRELFCSLDSFKEMENPHKRLHELGFKAYESAKRDDKGSIKQDITEMLRLGDEIISLLARLESEI
ncbi:MAG: CZB domain-containing protein [Nitrospirae bacterium]|nr:CZB domain-containing protein [Nitrospirota bacterium]